VGDEISALKCHFNAFFNPDDPLPTTKHLPQIPYNQIRRKFDIHWNEPSKILFPQECEKK
jgi:hypothetical protein